MRRIVGVVVAVFVSWVFGAIWWMFPYHNGSATNLYRSLTEWCNDSLAVVIAYYIPPMAVFVLVYLPFVLWKSAPKATWPDSDERRDKAS